MGERAIPEGEFYSRLYAEMDAPKDDSKKARNRIAAYFAGRVYDRVDFGELGSEIDIETGAGALDEYHRDKDDFEEFFRDAPIADVLTAITLIWQHLGQDEEWRAFIERVFKEENVKYRVDAKCGVHPGVDQEFDRNRVSAIECLAEQRYTAVRHAAEAAFDELSALPVDGEGSARNIFEAAEALSKTIIGSGAALDEGLVNKDLRRICDRLFENDAQLKSTIGGLLSSFSKWVAAIHPYRHGHEREQPLTLPDDIAILAVSQGAGFIRWLREGRIRSSGRPTAKSGRLNVRRRRDIVYPSLACANVRVHGCEHALARAGRERIEMCRSRVLRARPTNGQRLRSERYACRVRQSGGTETPVAENVAVES